MNLNFKTALVCLSLLFFASTQIVNAQDVPKEYYVYSDKFDNGSPSGIFGAKNGSSLKFDAKSTESPFKGSNCLKVTADGSEAWSVLFIQQSGQGRKKDTQYANLSSYKALVFYARSDKDYTVAKLGMGEGGEFKKEEAKIALTKEWKRYVMEFEPGDRSSVNGLFLIVFEGAGTVYLDEIEYVQEVAPLAGDVTYGIRKTPIDSTAFYIYADKFINGIPTGYMGSNNGSSIKFDTDNINNPKEGPKCIKIEINKTEEWRGIHIQFTGHWNTALKGDEKLPDLSKYKKLQFYARTDGEHYSLKEVGVGSGEAGEEKVSDTYLDIEKDWKKYEINIKGLDLTRVNTLLYLVLDPGTIYLDEIRFIK